MMVSTEKNGKTTEAEIKDFKENHTDTTVSFTVIAEKAKIDKWESEKSGLIGKFKLSGSLSTNNQMLFDTSGGTKKIAKYDTSEDILNEFYQVRLDFYDKRKKMLVEKLQREQRILSNKARFVEEVCSGDLVVSNRKRNDLLADLQERKYETFQNKDKKKDVSESSDQEDDEDEEMEASEADLAKGYEYLLGMKIWSLTYEKAEALRAELAEKTKELNELQATEPSHLWLRDLDAIDEALDQRDVEIQKAVTEEIKAQKKTKKRQAKVAAKKKKNGRGKKKADQWDSDLESSSDEDESSDDSPIVARTKKPTAVRRKPAAKPAPKPLVTAPVAKKAVPAAAAANPPADDDSDDEFSGNLLDRLKLSDGGKNSSAGALAAAAKKRSSPKMADHEVDSEKSSDELDVFDHAPPAKNKVAQETKRARDKAASKKYDLMDDDDDDDIEVVQNKPTKKKAAAKARTRTGRAAAGKKQAPIQLDDSDEESFNFDESSSSGGEEEQPAARAGRGGGRTAGRATKKVNYAQSDEDDSDFDY